MIAKNEILPSGNRLVWDDPAMQLVIDDAIKLAKHDVTILISGETGSGKGAIAELIVAKGRRNEKPFITKNCATFPETMIEAELFGYEKGAFTGAINKRKGAFRQADRGTIFLDEIGHLPLNLQPKLLSVLERQEVYPLGEDEPVKVDVRIITASHKDLDKAVSERTFIGELYHRLKVHALEIPPLRKRPRDIIALARYFLEEKCRARSFEKKFLNEDAEEVLRNYSWPGNVRELDNVIDRLVIMVNKTEVTATDVKRMLNGNQIAAGNKFGDMRYWKMPGSGEIEPLVNFAIERIKNLEPTGLKSLIRNLVLMSLGRTGYDYEKTAELLNYDISRVKNAVLSQLGIPLIETPKKAIAGKQIQVVESPEEDLANSNTAERAYVKVDPKNKIANASSGADENLLSYEIEQREKVKKALEQAEGTKTVASKIYGCSYSYFLQLCKKYNFLRREN